MAVAQRAYQPCSGAPPSPCGGESKDLQFPTTETESLVCRESINQCCIGQGLGRRLVSQRSLCTSPCGLSAKRVGSVQKRADASQAVLPGSDAGVDRARRAAPADDAMFSSYAQLAHTLLNDVSGVCLLDGKLRSCGQTGASEPEPIARSLRALGWTDSEPRVPVALAQGQGQYLTAVPLLQDDGVLLGVFCVQRALGTSAVP